MSALVLDVGALIALNRNDRLAWSDLAVASAAPNRAFVPAAVLAQVWRSGSRQANLARAIGMCRELPLTGVVARACGVLCGATHTTDVVDASVAVAAATIARSTDTTVLTSDPDDIRVLLDKLRSTARIDTV